MESIPREIHSPDSIRYQDGCVIPKGKEALNLIPCFKYPINKLGTGIIDP